MNYLLQTIALATFLLTGSGWAIAAVVNLDGMTHVKGIGVSYSPVTVSLGAGTYVVTPTDSPFVAFSPWSSNIDCNPSCAPSTGVHHGYMHYWGLTVDGIEILDRPDTWNGLAYDSPQDAFANAVPGISFSLGSSTDVEFYIPTGSPLTDNRGGISLSVTPVPIPAVGWLFGFAFLGVIAKGKKT